MDVNDTHVDTNKQIHIEMLTYTHTHTCEHIYVMILLLISCESVSNEGIRVI